MRSDALAFLCQPTVRLGFLADSFNSVVRAHAIHLNDQ